MEDGQATPDKRRSAYIVLRIYRYPHHKLTSAKNAEHAAFGGYEVTASKGQISRWLLVHNRGRRANLRRGVN
jgi:hypothetical protein